MLLLIFRENVCVAVNRLHSFMFPSSIFSRLFSCVTRNTLHEMRDLPRFQNGVNLFLFAVVLFVLTYRLFSLVFVSPLRAALAPRLPLAPPPAPRPLPPRPPRTCPRTRRSSTRPSRRRWPRPPLAAWAVYVFIFSFLSLGLAPCRSIDEVAHSTSLNVSTVSSYCSLPCLVYPTPRARANTCNRRASCRASSRA